MSNDIVYVGGQSWREQISASNYRRQKILKLGCHENARGLKLVNHDLLVAAAQLKIF